jgi:hypothetical protein
MIFSQIKSSEKNLKSDFVKSQIESLNTLEVSNRDIFQIIIVDHDCKRQSATNAALHCSHIVCDSISVQAWISY